MEVSKCVPCIVRSFQVEAMQNIYKNKNRGWGGPSVTTNQQHGSFHSKNLRQAITVIHSRQIGWCEEVRPYQAGPGLPAPCQVRGPGSINPWACRDLVACLNSFRHVWLPAWPVPHRPHGFGRCLLEKPGKEWPESGLSLPWRHLYGMFSCREYDSRLPSAYAESAYKQNYSEKPLERIFPKSWDPEGRRNIVS